MSHYQLFQTCVVLALLISLISGLPLSYDQLDEENGDMLLSSSEIDGEIDAVVVGSLDMFFSVDKLDPESDVANIVNRKDFDDVSLDSYEERLYHERSISSSTRPTNAAAGQTRQALIHFLQKAYDQGWRPNLKHYIPATRFGRHRR